MTNYSMQYKQYYEGIKNRGVKQYTPIAKRNTDTSNSYSKIENCISTSNKKTSKSSNKFIGDLINVFVNQLIIVIVMFMGIFYMKYSGTEEGMRLYTILEQSINREVETVDGTNSTDIENIISDAKSYIELIQNKIEKQLKEN